MDCLSYGYLSAFVCEYCVNPCNVTVMTGNYILILLSTTIIVFCVLFHLCLQATVFSFVFKVSQYLSSLGVRSDRKILSVVASYERGRNNC